MPNPIANVSRRHFLKAVGATGATFTLGVHITGCAKQETPPQDGSFEPDAFIKVFPDNRIRIFIKHLDMGQGAFTGLSTVVADEMDAAWEQLQAEHAPADVSKYAHIGWGTQSTGGSAGLKDAYTQMRQAGATAKAMLLSAAAQKWQVDESELKCEQSEVIHPATSKRANYGELAALAATLPVPAADNVPLKKPEAFIYIGKKVSRLDTGKENGTAIYTQDIQLPNMLTAVVLHPPKFGAKLKDFDASKAKAIKGVVDVFAIPTGVAIVADNFWLAKTARDQVRIQWDESKANTLNTDKQMADYKAQAKTPGPVARNDGNAVQALKSANKVIEGEFEVPYLAHAAMEPMNCVALANSDGCQLWGGIQGQTGAQGTAAHILGIDPQQVKVNTLMAGGSFGRRVTFNNDYVAEAVRIAKQVKGRPVKLVWTREDDTQAGQYRPMYYHNIHATTDAQGNIDAWHHKVVGQSIFTGTPMENLVVKNGVDHASLEGATDMPYTTAHRRVELHSPPEQVPVSWWRSVGHTHTAFAKEVMIDKLAVASQQDPFAFRLKHLDPASREANVLRLAAEKANWSQKLPKGWGKGIAVHKSFDTYVAEVAEVSVDEQGGFKVERVVCVVDCGVPVNPNIIEAQMQGGIGFGLGPVINSQITFKQGKVEQSNFNDYQVARMKDMPQVEVHIVPSTEPPTGVGEPSTCVIAPAVVNALANATGRFYTRLPITTLS